MKPLIAAMVMTVAATVVAQQPNKLDTFRQSCEQQQQSFLAQYGKALGAVMANLKKRGDLDNVLILLAEQKRFDADKTVPIPADAKDPFRPATEAYYQARVTLLEQYVKALDGLIKKEVTADRIEEAKVIKTEKEKISFVLADMQAKLSVKAGADQPFAENVEKPVPPSSVVKAKTLVDETRGFAGIFSQDNVYTFKIESVEKKTILRFWASGDVGTDTSGQVLLTGPDVKEQVIRQWKPSDFSVAADTVSSYKKLKPISCDISSHVKQAGEYQVTFKWDGGQIGLAILRVELELQ